MDKHSFLDDLKTIVSYAENNIHLVWYVQDPALQKVRDALNRVRNEITIQERMDERTQDNRNE